MTNPNIERLLREIAKEQEAEEEYLFGRIDQLEQLCKDFWNTLRFEMGSDWIEHNKPRMEQLGLIEADK